MILATYFGGRTSRAQPVCLTVEAGEVVLFELEGMVLRRVSFFTLRVSERAEHAPRLITFEDGVFYEINYPAEQTSLNVLLHRTGYREGWVAVAQNSWKLTLGPLLTTVVVLALGYRCGLPWGTRVVASMAPQHVETQLGRNTLKAMDKC